MDPTDFSPAEYAVRLARIRAAMARDGLDALIVSDPSNMAWATGYDGWSFYVHQAVIIGPEGPPLWWGRGMDAAGARRTVYMEPEHIHEYADIYVQNPACHPMESLAALIAAQHDGTYRWVDDVRSLDAQSFDSADSVALVPRVAIATPEAWQTAWGVLSTARQSASVVLTRVDAADVRAVLGCRDTLAPLDVRAGECWVAEPGAPPVRARWHALSTS